MKKGTLKPKIEKRALLSLFTVFVQIFVEKKSQTSVQAVCGDQIWFD